MQDKTPVTLNEGSMSALSGMRPDISGSGPGVSGMMPDCEVRTTSGVTEAASPPCDETEVSWRSHHCGLTSSAPCLYPPRCLLPPLLCRLAGPLLWPLLWRLGGRDTPSPSTTTTSRSGGLLSASVPSSSCDVGFQHGILT